VPVSLPELISFIYSNLTAVPLDVGQGCIAGPKESWVGMYWVAPTLFYTVSVRLFLSLDV